MNQQPPTLTTYQRQIAEHYWNGMLHMIRTFTKEDVNAADAMNIWPLAIEYASKQHQDPSTISVAKAFEKAAGECAKLGMPVLEQVFSHVSNQLRKHENEVAVSGHSEHGADTTQRNIPK